MNLALLLLIAIYSGLAVSKEYVASIPALSWIEVNQNCEDNGMILATFDTPSDVEEIYNLCVIADRAGGRFAGGCWLGFHDLDDDLIYEFVDDGEIVDDEADGLWLRQPTVGARCGCILLPDSYTNSLAVCECEAPFDVHGICEIIESEGEEICNDYLYIDDYGAANYEEAQAVCNAVGGGLATITSEDDCECVKGALNGTEAAWMGLNSLDHEGNLFFEYDDGIECPEEFRGSGACLSEGCWVNGRPLNCDDEEGGSKCVGISEYGLSNDISCDDTRNGILCNLASGSRAKQIKVNEILDHSFYKKPIEAIPFASKIVFWGSIVFVLMINFLCCYLCLCRSKQKAKAYDDKMIL